MNQESVWKDADVIFGEKKDDVYRIQCTECKNTIVFTDEELHNSTAENPIICGNCGHQSYLDKDLNYLDYLTT